MTRKWFVWGKKKKKNVVEFKYPSRLYPGDEVVCQTLKVGPISDKIRITFHWGDQYIQVLGANMVSPNVFEFTASDKECIWFLKYCVSQNAKPSFKCLYLSIEKIKSNKTIVWLARSLAFVLFILPLLLYIDRALGANIVAHTAIAELSLGNYSLTLPISLIIFIALWTSKVTEFINRLASVREVVDSTYVGKGVSAKYIEIERRPNPNENNRLLENIQDAVIRSQWQGIWTSEL